MPRVYDPERRCLDLADWPQTDQRAWHAAIEARGWLDEPAPLAGRAAVTLRNYRRDYGRWLSFLVGEGLLDPETAPAERIRPVRILRYIERLTGLNASSTVAHRVLGLKQVAGAFAPDHDWSWLRPVVRKLLARAEPARRKPAALISSAELLAAGLHLAASAESVLGLSPIKRALRHRNGLLLAMLASRPLRVANLAAIRLGQHLQQVGMAWQINFAANETKSRTMIELPFPSALVPTLEQHLARWRPVLLKGDASDRLWLSMKARALSAHEIQLIVVRIAGAHLGLALSPHRFRDALATDVAINDPAEVRIASVLLGHRQLRTTERFYNLARQREAAHRWQDGILRRRQQLQMSSKD